MLLWEKRSSPEGFDEPLHLLSLTLNTDVVLKLPERLVQLHSLEVHFIHHTADGTGDTERLISAALYLARRGDEKNDSLQNIPVELLLPISQEFADHLPAQALPLQQEMGHAHRCVGDEPPFRQILDALFWLPGRTSGNKM